MNLLIYKTERVTDTESKLMVTQGKGVSRDKPGDWDGRIHATVYR